MRLRSKHSRVHRISAVDGSRYLQTQAGISIAVDSVMVLVFLAYLLTRRPATS